MTSDTIEVHFKAFVLRHYGSAAADFFFAVKGRQNNAYLTEVAVLTKKDFKSAIKTLGLGLGDAARKHPRKTTAGGNAAITAELFTQFTEGKNQPKPRTNRSETKQVMADLPMEVPVLPAAFKARPAAHKQLVIALLDADGKRSTAVCAPKSRVSSQGMGGVGKTMLAAAVVRDQKIRRAFERIACELECCTASL